jgi:sugar phosphate isomerase/epimerase
MNIVAASTLPYLNLPFPEALKKIDDLGFEAVEIYFEGKHGLSTSEIDDALSVYDFKIFLHAPFSDLNLASFNQTVLAESKKQIKSSLEIASEINADISTIHFGRYSPLGLSYPEAAEKTNLESVREINSFSENLGIDIAFENSPSGFGAMSGPLDFIQNLVNELGIGLTLDIGHANSWDDEIGRFISELNSSIYHLHLHDNTGESDMHLALGDGDIDYERVFSALRKINYKNALCLEMLYPEDLEKSFTRLESIFQKIS